MKSREEYIDKMSRQLKEWSAKIDELESRLDSVSADKKSEYKRRIRDIQEKREAMSRKLLEIRSASGDAWKTLTTGMDNAWDDFKDTFKSAMDKFKKAA
jgi:chromosome segregation ATPase